MITLQADSVELHWPTKIALNPLDNSLHIVDDNQVPSNDANIVISHISLLSIESHLISLVSILAECQNYKLFTINFIF